jgi:hypothetical protein
MRIGSLHDTLPLCYEKFGRMTPGCQTRVILRETVQRKMAPESTADFGVFPFPFRHCMPSAHRRPDRSGERVVMGECRGPLMFSSPKHLTEAQPRFYNPRIEAVAAPGGVGGIPRFSGKGGVA